MIHCPSWILAAYQILQPGLPRYQAILRQQQERRAASKALSQALLHSRERPFSFYEADLLRAKQRQEDSDLRDAAVAVQQQPFRATPVPASTHEVMLPQQMLRNRLPAEEQSCLLKARR